MFYIFCILSYVLKFSGKWLIQKDIRPYRLCIFVDFVGNETKNRRNLLLMWSADQLTGLSENVLSWQYSIYGIEQTISHLEDLISQMHVYKFNCTDHAYASTTGISNSHFKKSNNLIIYYINTYQYLGRIYFWYIVFLSRCWFASSVITKMNWDRGQIGRNEWPLNINELSASWYTTFITHGSSPPLEHLRSSHDVT